MKPKTRTALLAVYYNTRLRSNQFPGNTLSRLLVDGHVCVARHDLKNATAVAYYVLTPKGERTAQELMESNHA